MDHWLTKLNIENFERRLCRCSDPAQQRVLRQLLEEERSKLACGGGGESEEGASAEASKTGESVTQSS